MGTYAGNDIYNGTYAYVSISTDVYMKSYVWFRPTVNGTYAYIYKMHIYVPKTYGSSA